MIQKKCVFLFPGQGSQTVGMGKNLVETFPELSRVYEEASDALGINMSRLCFEDPDSQLALTEFTQPALLTTSTAAGKVLERRFEVVPSAVAGHSLGEYSALVQAKALDFATALRAVRFRGQAMQRAVPVGLGAMAAYLGTQVDRVKELCLAQTREGNGVVEIVNYNSKSQLVLSGHKTAVDAAVGKIAAEKLGKAIPLKVSAPFHSALMKPAAEEMGNYLESVALNELSVALCANVSANVLQGNKYTKAMLVSQVASPVLWTQSLEALLNHTTSAAPTGEGLLWVEIGTGNVLQGLLKKTLDEQTAFGTNESEQLLEFVKAVLNA
jgi:[acyl-carrier-protein] S-malonyltransferase